MQGETQTYPGFEFVSPIPFLTMITDTVIKSSFKKNRWNLFASNSTNFKNINNS